MTRRRHATGANPDALAALCDDMNTPGAMAALQQQPHSPALSIMFGESPARRARTSQQDEAAILALARRAAARQSEGDGEGAARILDGLREAGFFVNLRPARGSGGPTLYYACHGFGAMIDWPVAP